MFFTHIVIINIKNTFLDWFKQFLLFRNSRTFRGFMQIQGLLKTSSQIQGLFNTVWTLYNQTQWQHQVPTWSVCGYCVCIMQIACRCHVYLFHVPISGYWLNFHILFPCHPPNLPLHAKFSIKINTRLKHSNISRISCLTF